MSYKKNLKKYVAHCYDIIDSEQLIIEECKLCIEDLDLQQELVDHGFWVHLASRKEEIIEARSRINYRQVKDCMQRIRVERQIIRQTKKEIAKL